MTTPEVAAELAKAETKATGVGPLEGGTAAAAQSLLDKQKNLAAKVNEVTHKAPEELTQKDASELQSREARVFGNAARTPGGLAAQIQSQVSKNQAAHREAEEQREAEDKQKAEEA